VNPGPRRVLPVAWRISSHARRLTTMAVTGLLIAVITRRAEFAGLAAPALMLLIPRQADRPDTIGVELKTSAQVLTEGEQAAVLVRVTGPGGPGSDGADSIAADQAQARLHPGGWILAEQEELGGDGWFTLPFLAQRWGIRPVGTVEVVVTDRWRLAECRLALSVPSVTCHPEPARLESLVVLSKLPARLGEHTSRRPGEGIEFAGVRDFVPGDRQRRINWSATTRRGSLMLNTFTAERAQTVVVLMDVSVDVGEPGRSSVDLAVRAAAGTTARYLAARDRVGLISFGKELRWVAPAAGRRQADRITNMITTQSVIGYPLGTISALPHTALPPGSLVIVFSPLLNIRFIETLRDLRERGFSVIVVDVLLAQPNVALSRYRAMADLARRIWRMEQDAIKFSLREIGIPVVTWDGQSPLDTPLAPFTRRPLVNR
jgi:uncharacterized protein (DUF58 family)